MPMSDDDFTELLTSVHEGARILRGEVVPGGRAWAVRADGTATPVSLDTVAARVCAVRDAEAPLTDSGVHRRRSPGGARVGAVGVGAAPCRCYYLALSFGMQTRHRRTLAALFAQPTRANLIYDEVVAMLRALGAEVDDRRAGSRVRVTLPTAAGPQRTGLHRPHPHKELLQYQVRDLRAFLAACGITPDSE